MPRFKNFRVDHARLAVRIAQCVSACFAGQIPDGLIEKFAERRHRNAGHINTFRRLLPPNLGVILTQNCSTNVSGIA